ncbi:HCL129Cp [Eremothecium sinecaudum]|uniref:HCL129Cp n=1 Tax=Eremothecium sinecaudum TaxID=45286 RepID=A0A0X8HRC6_9SACH|nr:HCL129Cp [Eremothecium sinecaudum]AMD20022.1 HCL129Cp [Eremothecium sinecaudum]
MDQTGQDQWLNASVLGRGNSNAPADAQMGAARAAMIVGSTVPTTTTSAVTNSGQAGSPELLAPDGHSYLVQGPGASHIGGGGVEEGVSQHLVQQHPLLGAGGHPPSLQLSPQGYFANTLPPIGGKIAEQQHFQAQHQHFQHMHDLHRKRKQHQLMLQQQIQRAKKQKIIEPVSQARETHEVTSRRATQENIIRLVALRNRDKPLVEYASTVRAAEVEVLNMDPSTHSKSDIQAAEQHRERERQVYALIWLINSCVPDAESYVPRGRIFAQYAASCASHNLKPLSQATLGKLIRSLFPHLKTRRLGMRGQSKYHYCGLTLVSSLLPEDVTATGTPISASISTPVAAISRNNSFNSTTTLDTDVMPETRGSVGGSDSNSVTMPTPSPAELSQTAVSEGNSECGNKNNILGLVGVCDTLKFIDNFFSRTCEMKVELPLALPSITPFLPSNVDPDIASSVESLYKVFCNQLFENIRFMKFDDLHSTFKSFSSGSISPQMYNLFISEELYEWIERSDIITYRALAKMLSSLIVEFDEIPDIVLDKLSHFSRTYLDLVSKSTIDLPLPVVTNKKRIVTQFTQLVKRLIKLIDTGKNAAKLLALDQTRQSMRQDWERYVNIEEHLASELSHFQEHYSTIRSQTMHFIQNDLLGLLEQERLQVEGNVSNGTFLINFAKKLSTLLQCWNHFPGRLVALSFVGLTTSTLRELSFHNAESFGAWWIFKSFIDEWVYWYGEVGCFLE